MPGETISIKNNKVYIDDHKIKDDYAVGDTENVEEITLKDNEYFVLGDNREVSKDSRVIGPIKKENIKGKAIFRLFPFNKFGTI